MCPIKSKLTVGSRFKLSDRKEIRAKGEKDSYNPGKISSNQQSSPS